MEKEDAIKYRANTNNRGYGFEQVNKNKSLPQKLQASALINSKSANVIGSSNNPYEYNFRAPGNY